MIQITPLRRGPAGGQTGAPVPLSLIAGFLGSGKTSLLRHLAQRHQGQRLGFLVNDFSPADVDGALLAGVSDYAVSVAGGSIFCQCLVGDFITALRRVHQDFHRPEAPLAGLVIEASGIADPRVVARMLRETRLDRLYSLRSVIAVVDPGSFPKLLATLPNIAAQVQAAGTVVVNKTDLFDGGAVRRTEQEAGRLNPLARITRTTFGRVDLPLFDSAAASGVPAVDGEYAPCADAHYARVVVSFAGPPAASALEPLRAALEPFSSVVYRAKGFVPTHGGVCYVDYSTAGWAAAEAAPAGTAPGLAIITHGGAETAEAVAQAIQCAIPGATAQVTT